MATNHNFVVKHGLEVGGVLIVNSSGQLEASTVVSDLHLQDNIKAKFGSGDDLQIYHDGTHSYIDEVGTGSLYIRANDFRLSNADGSQNHIIANNNGEVSLRYSGSPKLATKSDGVDITGELQSDSLDVDGAADISGTLKTGSQVVIRNGTTYEQSSDILYVGGNGLDSSDAAIYLGNHGNGGGYGWRFFYEGSGGSNLNKLIIRSENLGSPVDALAFTQDGAATFADNVTISGDLNIVGDLNTVSVTDLDVVDKTITLGVGQSAANSTGSGIVIAGSNAELKWNNTNTRWEFNEDIYTSGKVDLGNNQLYASGDNNHLHINAPTAIIGPSTTTSSNPSLGTSAYEWNGIYSNNGDFSGTVTSGLLVSEGASSGRYTGLEVVNTTNAAGTETAIGLGVVSVGNNSCDVKLVANRVGANSGSDFYIEQTDSAGNQDETLRITENGDATFLGSISMGQGGFNVDDAYYAWKRVYSVSNTSPQELLYKDGTSLDQGGVYRFTAHISGTGTDNNTTAVFWYQDTSWRYNVVGQSGTGSNHPEFIIDATTNKPTIRFDHTSTYNVHIYHEWMRLNEELAGTDNKGYAFGTDGFLGSVDGVLRYRPDGTADTGVDQYTDGYTVWHSNNDGATSGLDADLLDGQHGSYYATAASLGSYLLKSGGTMTGDITMGSNQIDFDTNGNANVPQFIGNRSSGDLNNRVFQDEGGFAYTTFESSTSNAAPHSSNNANGLITMNTHGGSYNHQLAFTNLGAIAHRFRNAGGLTDWAIVLTDDKPATPSITSTTTVNETIEIVFAASTTTNQHAATTYEVWSDGGTGSDYSLIAKIPYNDIASSMSVVDSSFDDSGTIAYRVYAIKHGVYSTAATTTHSFSMPSMDVSSMSVVPDTNSYHIQYNLPDTRFLDHVEIYMDAEAVSSNLTRTGASLVYSGNNPSYTYSISNSDMEKYHQFWVECVSV